MANLKTMYKGVVNSPETYLKEVLTQGATVMYVADGSVFGTLPTLATIGDSENAETVLVKSKRSDGGYDIQRGFEGTDKKWDKATVVARNFTNYDYQTLVDNTNTLNTSKVDKVSGKNLSTNDFTTAYKNKLNNLSSTATGNEATTSNRGYMSAADKSKLNSIDLSKYATTSTTDSLSTKIQSVEQTVATKADKTDIKTKLSDLTADNTHRTVTDAEKTTWNNKAEKNAIPTIVNDLTSGGTDKALSAEQGKVLFQNVDNGKLLIANAIIDRGETKVSKESSFYELAMSIKNIKTEQTVDGNKFVTQYNENLSTFIKNNKDNLVILPNIFDTSNLTNMFGMFEECSKLTEVPLFDTSNVTSMYGMFFGCSKLTEVPLFNTSNVTIMNNMFYGCSSLTEVPLFNTSNVTVMERMFFGCSKLTEVPLFDTSNVTSMYGMFFGCSKLTEVPLFDTQKVSNYDIMFKDCYNLDLKKMREIGWEEKFLQTAPNYKRN